jgi:alpha-methylacyl-CoA racemase
MLDGGAHFYQVYKCQDGGFMAVGSIESKFYQKLLKGLEYSDEQIEKMVAEQLDQEKWEKLKKEFAILFMKKTRN